MWIPVARLRYLKLFHVLQVYSYQAGISLFNHMITESTAKAIILAAIVEYLYYFDIEYSNDSNF